MTDIEEYLTDIMNYFNPLESNDQRPSDPYITWQLMSITEEDESNEDNIEQHKEQMNTNKQVVTRRNSSKSQISSKRSVSSNGRSSLAQTFGNFARMISSRMKRPTTSSKSETKANRRSSLVATDADSDSIDD